MIGFLLALCCCARAVVRRGAALTAPEEAAASEERSGDFLWPSDDADGAFSVLTQRALREFTFARDDVASAELVAQFERDGMMDELPPSDEFLGWLRKRPRSCAIVGNSGILNGQAMGDEIDSHDVTLRFNLAPTVGRFARDVGHKTTILMLNYDKAMLIVENSTLLDNYHSLQWLWINPHNRLQPKPAKVAEDLRLFLRFARDVRAAHPDRRVVILSDVWKELAKRVLHEVEPGKCRCLLCRLSLRWMLFVCLFVRLFVCLFVCLLFVGRSWTPQTLCDEFVDVARLSFGRCQRSARARRSEAVLWTQGDFGVGGVVCVARPVRLWRLGGTGLRSLLGQPRRRRDCRLSLARLDGAHLHARTTGASSN